MPTIKSIEQAIYRVERFKVRFLHEDGRDIRSDKARVPGYRYKRSLDDAANVREWIDGRFKKAYPGYRVEVLDSTGNKVHGGTRLATVRETYLDWS